MSTSSCTTDAPGIHLFGWVSGVFFMSCRIPLMRYVLTMRTATAIRIARKVINNESATLPPLALDVDTVRDAIELMQRAAKLHGPDGARPDHVTVESVKPGVHVGMPLQRPVKIEDIPTLPRSERQNLLIQGYALLDLRRESIPTIWSSDTGLVRELTRLLLDEGRRLVPLRWTAQLVPILIGLGLIAAWVWCLLSLHLPAPAIVTGSLIVLAVLGCCAYASSRILTWQRKFYLGHRVTEATRASVRDRIANTRATLIISAITVPVGAAIGSLVTFLLAG